MIQEKAFIKHLKDNGYSQNTIAKYHHDLRLLKKFLGKRELSKENLVSFKDDLLKQYQAASINSIIACINSYLNYKGLYNLRLKRIKVQRKIFEDEKELLNKDDYKRLLNVAREDDKARLILETICSTGIRVSELRYFTVEALDKQRLQVMNKGKERIIFLPPKLIIKLKKYVKRAKIQKGAIFITRNGKPLDRVAIWRKMKRLGQRAGIILKKVFPHNLRHLFATTYYNLKKDIAKLADLLGHSSISTTRLYILSSGHEHYHDLERMELIQ